MRSGHDPVSRKLSGRGEIRLTDHKKERGKDGLCDFSLMSFLASTIGCIHDIGGGIIMKPVMDVFHICSVSTISFLSGSVVLSVTAYSVARAELTKKSAVEKGSSVWTGLGAATGGITEKLLEDPLRLK